MRAGLLKETITVYTPTVTRNAVGEQVVTYTDKGTIRARSVIYRQQRANLDGDIDMPRSHTLEVRIFQDITEHDIIEWQGKRYRILSIDVDTAIQCKRLEVAEINE